MAIPSAWLPKCAMKRVVAHWSAGGHKVSAIDKEHYHIIYGGDGEPVRGDHEISDNVSTGDGDYAAHTRGCNSGSIGVSLACMAGAVESPFNPGKYPMTKKQWDAMIEGIAQLCKFYGIPVTPKTVLSHAEVQGTLGIAQRGKWDFTRLAFDLEVKGAKACGDKMRAEVTARLGGVQPIPEPEQPTVGAKTGSTLWIQQSLNKIGLTPKLDEDGKEGSKTDGAIRMYAIQAIKAQLEP